MDNDILLVQKLKKIGLSEKEALVYFAVLEIGSAFPSKISEKTKLNRSTVYKILLNLSIKGLITEIEKNRKICYQIEPPYKLVNYTKNKIRMAEDSLQKAIRLVPEITGLFSLVPDKPKVRFFDGVDGITNIISDHVAEEKPYEMLAYSNVEELVAFFPSQFAQNYVKTKDRIGITTRAIFPDTKFSMKYNKEIYRRVDKKTLVKTKMIPAELFPYKGELTIYGQNKVSIVNIQKECLIGIIIEDKTISNLMRMIFELSWIGADNLKKGNLS